MIARPAIDVAVAVIRNDAGHYLLSKRQMHQDLGGLWEFPGGKIMSGESWYAALCRECHEELGIVVQSASRMLEIWHDYGNKTVLLSVWQVEHYVHEPQGQEGQQILWVQPDALKQYPLPRANAAIIAVLA